MPYAARLCFGRQKTMLCSTRIPLYRFTRIYSGCYTAGDKARIGNMALFWNFC